MKVDILLVYPKLDYFDFTEGLVEPPLGLYAIAAPCVKLGYNVRIIDQRIDRDWKENILDILKDKPLCVGIGSMSGPQLSHTMKLVKLIKEHFPKQLIVIGGPHATMLPDQVISVPEVDIVVPYEGEKTFADLVEGMRRKTRLQDIKGIVFKEDGKVIKTPENEPVSLDSLDTSLYELIDFSKYHNTIAGERSIKFFPDRGCPHRCAFCNQNDYFQNNLRQMNAANIHAHLKALTRFNVKAVSLGDGSFMSYRSRLKELLNLLEKDNPGLLIRCTARVDDINYLDDEFLIRLKSVGFFALQIGVESGSDRVLELMNKKITVKDVLETNSKLKRVGIIPLYSFMGGVPGEHAEDGQKTLDLMMKLSDENPMARLSNLQLFRLLPGKTKFWQIAKDEFGARAPTEIDRWFDFFNMGHPWLTTTELRLFKKWDIISYFIELQSKFEFYDRTWFKPLARIYSSIVKRRIKTRFYGMMPEMLLLRLFTKQ